MQQSREIAVGRVLKPVELAHQGLVAGPDRIARHTRSIVAAATAADTPDVLVLREIDRARFPPVGIVAIEPRGGGHVVAQLANRRRVEIERIAQRRGRGGELGDVVQLGEDAVQLLIAIERIAPPHAVEIAPLGQLAAGPADPIDRTVIVVAAITRPDAPAQRAADAFRRMLEAVVQPGAKGVVEDPGRARLGEHFEQRVDTGLNRPFAQQIRAETRESC